MGHISKGSTNKMLRFRILQIYQGLFYEGLLYIQYIDDIIYYITEAIHAEVACLNESHLSPDQFYNI